ncbi:MAG: response regulator [Verrucomicrobiota bacterium]
MKTPKPILIVDDQDSVLDLLRDILEHRGFRVVTATTQETAYQEWLARPDGFDLVLMDINLSFRGEGLEFAEKLREENPATPIVFISGMPTEQFEGGTLVSGVNYLRKPFSPHELMTVVEKQVRKA